MNGLKKTLGMAGMAAMLMASTTPAMARPGWGGGWGGHGGGYRGFGGYGHYHHGGDGFGNFLLGAIVAGGIVAVASSASRSDREARVVEGPSGRPDHSNWSDSESDAANICADAAQDLASKRGLDAHVDDVDTVDPDEAEKEWLPDHLREQPGTESLRA